MPSSILNSDDGVISGTSGLKSSGGDDGVLKIQNNGTDAITVADDGEVTLAAKLTVASPIVAAAGTALLPSITTTGDVNTGIFFSAANTVDIATDGVAQAQINSAGDFAINAGFGSVGKAYLCRAWVNFDGTTNVGGNCTIRASGNVSTVADNGPGDYTVNFTTAMPDVNYSVSTFSGNDGATSNCRSQTTGAAFSTGSVSIRTFDVSGSQVQIDDGLICVQVVR